MQVIWSPAALREIDHIYGYIAQFSPRAAEHMVIEILAEGDRLEAVEPAGARRCRSRWQRRDL